MHWKKQTILIVLLVSINTIAQERQTALETQKEKISYSIGVDVARSFIQREFDIDYEVLIEGIKDVFSKRTLLMSDEEIKKVITDHKVELARNEAQKRKVVADLNKEEGYKYLAENKKKDGIVTIENGLQYRIINEGIGEKPSDEDIVEIQYEGSLIDGKIFTSTYMKGEADIMPLKAFIPGMKEALKLMPVGSKWRLFIPPELAYGTRGAGIVEPNATVIYEIELLSIKNASVLPNLKKFN